ncbi:hypothetical protein CRUP_011952 [Coryphaenoides rupestris]|nr:hypothetical protein CRUP_011952 [Coryphaenoides rupestris]
MAAMRTLTVAGLFLAFCSLGLIAIAIGTDNWYETDARRHLERCKNYSNKQRDPGFIYISSNNLPLRMLPPDRRGSPGGGGGGGGMLLRATRELSPLAHIAMESLCSRHFNSTITGLWRKCHREGFDQETEDLIFKEEANEMCFQTPMGGGLKDIGHGYGWSMFCAWGGLGLTLLAGFLCTLAPSLYPPHTHSHHSHHSHAHTHSSASASATVVVVDKPRHENGCV